MAEAGDLKSLQCGFETRRGHQSRELLAGRNLYPDYKTVRWAA
jgi:hypothetical protein